MESLSRDFVWRLERLYLALAAVLFLITAAFALTYESFEPWWWHFSRLYLLAGLAPLGLLGAALVAL